MPDQPPLPEGQPPTAQPAPDARRPNALDEPSEAATTLDDAEGLDIEQFADAAALESWLATHHATSHGIWVRLYRPRSGRRSVDYDDVVRLSRAVGWRTGTRVSADTESYLQRIRPR
ncbi:hypothetical protein OEB99_02170 [Actinotalea sp. M2MS4P-6]|uniref:YdeI/OmpD-associated family protein n=1 Tax=Actinotalea sp. M2MS4P-6 TaxID=2983762 RepID=UPI0021E4B54C|nr:hypothetical protein [Actinotalea sp. M2MS4P-6]MCV2393104.1 hypothetical protein [Actinotalea sp. M2MS4P-6]